MNKLTLTLTLICALGALAAHAGMNADVAVTIPTGATAATGTVRVIRGGAPIQRIVAVAPTASGENATITIAAVDGQALTPVVATATLTNATPTMLTPRLTVGSTAEAYVVDTIRVTASYAATNALPRVVYFRIQSK